MTDPVHTAMACAPDKPADAPAQDPPAGPRSGFVEHQVAGVAILLWSADPDSPHRLATPFFHAAAAAAMDIPVEIYFTAASVRLLAQGLAATIRPNASHQKTVLDSIREATSFGVKLYACSDALAAYGLDEHALIDECSGRGGALQFMGRAADLRWRTLVF